MTKNIEYYLSLPYTIEMTPDEDGFWFAEIPLLEGCMTNGYDWNDALEMIQDAKRAWLTTALEIGLPIPEPEFAMSQA
jgi:antitoxin HicB